MPSASCTLACRYGLEVYKTILNNPNGAIEIARHQSAPRVVHDLNHTRPLFNRQLTQPSFPKGVCTVT